ncbi:MAG: hypothetical protein ACRD1K_16190 [Acidimicrobiales bacterium]
MRVRSLYRDIPDRLLPLHHGRRHLPGRALGGRHLPGGFGWVRSTDCGALITAGGWVAGSTGIAVPGDCHPVDWRDQTILLPVYDDTNSLGVSHDGYHVAGFAAFHVTGPPSRRTR